MTPFRGCANFHTFHSSVRLTRFSAKTYIFKEFGIENSGTKKDNTNISPLVLVANQRLYILYILYISSFVCPSVCPSIRNQCARRDTDSWLIVVYPAMLNSFIRRDFVRLPNRAPFSTIWRTQSGSRLLGQTPDRNALHGKKFGRLRNYGLHFLSGWEVSGHHA